MSRQQTIYRTEKNRENPYVMVDKQFIECATLSFRAKAVLVYILSKPDHWKVNVKDIANNGKEGRDAVYATLKELMEHGYLQRICHREKGKIAQYEYIVNERAELLVSEQASTIDSQEAVPFPEKLETDTQEAENVVEIPLVPEMPEAEESLEALHVLPRPEKPYTGNPTQVSNDFNNKLITKTCSSRARCITFDLWQEAFQCELSEREYDAFLKVCSRTQLARTICLIQEHHCVPSILSPFPFVMSCVTSGGYKVPKKECSPRPNYEPKRRTGLPKSVQQQLEGKRENSPYTPEELAKKKLEVQEKIRRLYEEESGGLRIV